MRSFWRKKQKTIKIRKNTKKETEMQKRSEHAAKIIGKVLIK